MENRGFDVMYTRVDDVYHTPYEKADMGNSAGADYFISIHRNAAGIPGTASGIMTLVYEDAGVNGRLARAVNEELEKTGYQDLGSGGEAGTGGAQADSYAGHLDRGRIY